MAGCQRPAGYIRVGSGSGADSLAAQHRAIRHTAYARGWPEPAMYLDIDQGGADQAVALGLAGTRQAAAGYASGFAAGAATGYAAGSGSGQALARLSAAISSGQHDALILGGIGTIRSGRRDLMTVLARCTRLGVTVECATPQPPGRGEASGEPRGPAR